MGAAMDGELCLVTGAASGIGAAVARRLEAAGATVYGADRSWNPERPSALPLERALLVDVAEEESVIEMLRRLRELAGAMPSVLVNVAGIGATTTAPDTAVEEWDRVFAVNARGTFLCCKHVLPAMIAAGAGSIVNVASVAGLVGLRRRAAYCASKGAVIAFTRALAVDHVADGVRANCICPGTVDSPWVRRLVEDSGEDLQQLRARQPMGRLGTPEEVAEGVLYLAGPSGGFATGSALVLDGGLTAG